MSHWILFVIVYFQGTTAVTSQTFQTSAACEKAGAALKQSEIPHLETVVTRCVEDAPGKAL